MDKDDHYDGANNDWKNFSVKRALKRRGWLEKPCDCCPKLHRCSNDNENDTWQPLSLLYQGRAGRLLQDEDNVKMIRSTTQGFLTIEMMAEVDMVTNDNRDADFGLILDRMVVSNVSCIRITFCFIFLFLPSRPPLLMGITKLPICLIAHWGCLKLPHTCTVLSLLPFPFLF